MCHKPECQETQTKNCCKYQGPSYPDLGIEAGMSFEDVLSAVAEFTKSIQTVDGQTGPQGDPGEDGVGITNVVSNAGGTITFTFSNGSTYTTPSLTGPQGIQGIPGLPGTQGMGTTFRFSNSGTTTPASGYFSSDAIGNNTATTTTFYFNFFNSTGQDVSAFINQFENLQGTQPRYGRLIITDLNNINIRVECDIIKTISAASYEVVIDNPNLRTNPVINTFTNGTEYLVTFVPSESVTKTIVIPYHWQVITSGYLYSLDITTLAGYGLLDASQIVNLEATVTSGIAGHAIFPIDVCFPVPGNPAGAIFLAPPYINIQAVPGRIFDYPQYDNLLQRGYITITFLK